MANKNLVFLSTHILTKGVISEYKKLLNIDGYDVVLAIDNTNLKLEANSRIAEFEFFDTKVKCFLFDENLSKELNLPFFASGKIDQNFSAVMWYNSDYRFYYVKKFFPDYEYYWQIEYDVFCNGKSYEPFFKKYDNDNKDLLIINYQDSELNSEWCWTNNIEWIYDKNTKIKKSLFPISRLSNKAIDFLYNQRLKHKEIYKNNVNNNWVFCELFVPTELFNNGFECGRICEPNIFLEPEFDLNEDRIFETPDNLLYHPIKGNFIEKIQNYKNEIKTLNKRIKDLERIKIKLNLFGIKITWKKRKK